LFFVFCFAPALVAAIERSADFHFPPLATQIRHVLLAAAAAAPRHRPFLVAARKAITHPGGGKDKASAAATTAAAAAAAVAEKGNKKATAAALAAVATPDPLRKRPAVAATPEEDVEIDETDPANTEPLRQEFLDGAPVASPAQLLSKFDTMFGDVPTPSFGDLPPSASVLDRDPNDPHPPPHDSSSSPATASTTAVTTTDDQRSTTTTSTSGTPSDIPIAPHDSSEAITGSLLSHFSNSCIV
jgi:hypothetical protein